jgi:GTP-binding protein
MPYVPVLFVSALTGQRVHRVLPMALHVAEERNQRLTTHQLNQMVQEAMFRHNPPSIGGRRLRVYFGTQAKNPPPTFLFFVNDPKLVHFGFRRYLENRIRELYPFEGTPIQLSFKTSRDRAWA